MRRIDRERGHVVAVFLPKYSGRVIVSNPFAQAANNGALAVHVAVPLLNGKAYILLRDGCAAWNRLFFLRQVPPLRDQGVDAPGDLRPFQQHIRASRFLQAYAFGVMFFMASRNARKRMGMTSYPVFIFKKIRLFLIRMGLREERGDAASPVLYAASAGKLSICFIPCDKSLQSGRFQQRGFVFLSRPIQLAQPFQQSHRLMIPIRKQVGVL